MMMVLTMMKVRTLYFFMLPCDCVLERKKTLRHMTVCVKKVYMSIVSA